jgi:hypothetical protein
MNDGLLAIVEIVVMGEDKQTNKTCGLQSLDSAKHVIGPRHIAPTFPLSPGSHHHFGQDNNVPLRPLVASTRYEPKGEGNLRTSFQVMICGQRDRHR